MKRFNSYYPINVFSFEQEHWEYDVHKHNFYELIFIEDGTGKHIINEITFNYQSGDIFFLAPDDAHEFLIEQKTTFIYLKFTEQAFTEILSEHPINTLWEQTLHNVLSRPHIGSGNVVCCKEEIQHAFALVRMLKDVFQKRPLYYQEQISSLFFALMIIITRNLNKHKSIHPQIPQQEKEKINNLLSYIRTNALDANKVNIKSLADRFLMSPNYISIYVKKHTGISIKLHIIHTKVKHAETLLQQGRWNINEISEKLGFNDASHFHKIYKKYTATSPSQTKTRQTR